MLLKAIGLDIPQEQLNIAWERAKDALPELSRTFKEMDVRQARLELTLCRIEDKLDALSNHILHPIQVTGLPPMDEKFYELPPVLAVIPILGE